MAPGLSDIKTVPKTRYFQTKSLAGGSFKKYEMEGLCGLYDRQEQQNNTRQ